MMKCTNGCGAYANFTCGRCSRVYYCNDKCADEHWVGVHHLSCGTGTVAVAVTEPPDPLSDTVTIKRNRELLLDIMDTLVLKHVNGGKNTYVRGNKDDTSTNATDAVKTYILLSIEDKILNMPELKNINTVDKLDTISTQKKRVIESIIDQIVLNANNTIRGPGFMYGQEIHKGDLGLIYGVIPRKSIKKVDVALAIAFLGQYARDGTSVRKRIIAAVNNIGFEIGRSSEFFDYFVTPITVST